jgi:hypothetical protein
LKGVVVAVSSCQVFSLQNLEIAESLACHQSPTYVGSIIGYCISFNCSFCSLIFLHVKREAKQVAHHLAKYDLHNLDCIWIEESEPCIYAILVFDLLSDFR